MLSHAESVTRCELIREVLRSLGDQCTHADADRLIRERGGSPLSKFSFYYNYKAVFGTGRKQRALDPRRVEPVPVSERIEPYDRWHPPPKQNGAAKEVMCNGDGGPAGTSGPVQLPPVLDVTSGRDAAAPPEVSPGLPSGPPSFPEPLAEFAEVYQFAQQHGGIARLIHLLNTLKILQEFKR